MLLDMGERLLQVRWLGPAELLGAPGWCSHVSAGCSRRFRSACKTEAVADVVRPGRPAARVAALCSPAGNGAGGCGYAW